MIENIKKELCNTKNFKNVRVVDLNLVDGVEEKVLMVDYDDYDDTYNISYTIFGDGILPYTNFESESTDITESLMELDVKISKFYENSLLLVNMGELYDSDDYTFVHSKGDMGNLYMKYKDVVCNLGINVEKMGFYIKRVDKMSTYEEPFIYEDLPEEDDDWKNAIYFCKYENPFNNNELVDHLISAFLSEDYRYTWTSLLPVGVVGSQNFILDSVELSFKNKKSLLTSLNYLTTELGKMTYMEGDI
jgi:hypothetical protein